MIKRRSFCSVAASLLWRDVCFRVAGNLILAQQYQNEQRYHRGTAHSFWRRSCPRSPAGLQFDFNHAARRCRL